MYTRLQKSDAVKFFQDVFPGTPETDVLEYGGGMFGLKPDPTRSFSNSTIINLVFRSADKNITFNLHHDLETELIKVNIHRLENNSRVNTPEEMLEGYRKQVPKPVSEEDKEADRLVDTIMDLLISAGGKRLNKGMLFDSRSPLAKVIGEALHQHMVDDHPDFARSFTSYLNAMSASDAVATAHRDLSVPGCLAGKLMLIAEHHNRKNQSSSQN